MNDTDNPADDQIRTFFALTVPPELVEAVRRIQGRARIDLPRGLRWIKPEQAHMTLAFLGDVNVESIPSLDDVLAEVASGFQPFTSTLAGISGFPRPERPRVVWAGVSPETSPVFEQMHHRLWALTDPIKPKPEKENRPFHPHLTLARVPGPQPPRLAEWMLKHADWQFGPWPIQEMQLIRSVLTNQGPVYETIARKSLGSQSKHEFP